LGETPSHLKASTDSVRPSISSFPIYFIIFFILPFEHTKLINVFLPQRNTGALLKSGRASGHGNAFLFLIKVLIKTYIYTSLAALQ